MTLVHIDYLLWGLLLVYIECFSAQHSSFLQFALKDPSVPPFLASFLPPFLPLN